ncbi:MULTISPECIES: DUF6318 family protein [unclassified Arthrobacter]|uniref:DUF6318 family protein n=1 Tax=unclassified Arthrobacter TaxID=235627 RepID=UPI00215780DF|nr:MULTISPECIES: DUF6318 family protein [unclassified Arthrobacter]
MFRTRVSSAIPASARLSAAAVGAVLVLGGCSGSGEPEAEAAEHGSSSASPTASATASESATPTPTAVYKPATAEGPAENVPLPVMPELAREKSKEGLEAFAEYWYSLINYGFETGDVKPIEMISGSDCVVCRSFYRMVNNGYASEDWIVGGGIEIVANHSDFIKTTDGMYQVLVNIRQDELHYRGPANTLYEVDEGIEEVTVQMIEGSYQGDHWVATHVVTIK